VGVIDGTTVGISEGDDDKVGEKDGRSEG